MQHLIKLYNDNAFLPGTAHYAFVLSTCDNDNNAYETNETKEIDFNSAYRRHKPNEHCNSNAKPKRVVLTEEDKALLLNAYKHKVNTALSNNIENIICFLPVQDKYTFTKLTKQTMKAFFNVVAQRLQKQLLPLQRRIDQLLYVNSMSTLSAPIPQFTLSKSAFKAIDLLNQKAYYTKFHEQRTPNDETLLVYKVYFLLLNNNNKVIELISDKGFDDKDVLWLKIREYFIWERKDLQLGQFVQSEIRNMDYSDKNVYSMKLFCKPYLSILNPLYYSKMCPTTGVFAFLVKEVLEYMGVVGAERGGESSASSGI